MHLLGKNENQYGLKREKAALALIKAGREETDKASYKINRKY